MSGHLITHLRYVGIAMPDIERQLSFYRDMWGLTEVAADTGVHFLAAEGSPEQYVVRLRRDDLKRQDLIAFGAASIAAVDTLAGRLTAGGVRLVHQPRPLDTPGGGLRVERQGEVRFSWQYTDGRSDLLKLYDKAKRAQWNVTTDLDWTIVRPGRLTDNAPTGRVQLGDLPPGEVTRADVAQVLAAVLEADNTVGRTFDVLNGDVPVVEAVAAV